MIGTLLLHSPDSHSLSLQNRVEWIPDFSQPIVVLRALLASVGIAILLTLLRSGFRGLDIALLGPMGLFAVWICCLTLAGWQLLRRYGSRLPLWVAASIALIWMVLCAGVCGMAPTWLGLPASVMAAGSAIDIALETMLVALIVGSMVLRALYAHFETQAHQRRLLQAKYDALQARIRPHFLFNSLNTVAELIEVDPEAAENAVLDLSDLFRATLADRGAVQIQQEMELCEKYLGVEKLRMGERLNWNFDVDDTIKQWRLPALCLQPLVENAVLHGVQQIPDGGCIELSVKQVEGDAHICVRNPVPFQVDHQPSRGTGTALINIRARLETFCQAPVIFDAAKDGEFYVVNLRVPAKSQQFG